MYRKLPLAGRPPRPVPVTHRVTGTIPAPAGSGRSC
jgi:hypothetical protein